MHFDSGVWPGGSILWGNADMGAGDYPHLPYPPRARDLQVSISTVGFNPETIALAEMPDRFGNVHVGGPGVARFRRENATRRTALVTLVDHDWVEVTDPFDIDDPDHTGIVPSELWVANGISIKYQGGSLDVSVELHSADYINAIKRGV